MEWRVSDRIRFPINDIMYAMLWQCHVSAQNSSRLGSPHVYTIPARWRFSSKQRRRDSPSWQELLACYACWRSKRYQNMPPKQGEAHTPLFVYQLRPNSCWFLRRFYFDASHNLLDTRTMRLAFYKNGLRHFYKRCLTWVLQEAVSSWLFGELMHRV